MWSYLGSSFPVYCFPFAFMYVNVSFHKMAKVTCKVKEGREGEGERNRGGRERVWEGVREKEREWVRERERGWGVEKKRVERERNLDLEKIINIFYKVKAFFF